MECRIPMDRKSTYFALYDVDGDGQEELLLNWTGASMADTVEYIWGIRR